MKYYTHEITGKRKELCEDAYFSKIYSNVATGEQVGLFIVADGLSGYSGRTASQSATHYLAEALEKRIRSKKLPNMESLLMEVTLATHNHLAESHNTYTTLDLALVLNSSIYTVHLGDGRIYFLTNAGDLRQITKDESAPGMPGNYLGREVIDGKSINERINIGVHTRTPDLAGILLATDGLHSRVPGPLLQQMLATIGKERTPGQVLELLDTMIQYPEKMLWAVDENLLRRNMLHGLERYTKIPTTAGMIEAILESYTLGEDKELMKRLDGGLDSGALKADDTEIILVDLLDRDAAVLGELLQKRQQVLGLDTRVAELDTMLRARNEEYSSVCREAKDWEQKYGMEVNARRTAEKEAARLGEELSDEKEYSSEITALHQQLKDRIIRAASQKDGQSFLERAKCYIRESWREARGKR